MEGLVLAPSDAHDDTQACVHACVRQDGLFTTVVVDELGVALGLVYSNRDSIRVRPRGDASSYGQSLKLKCPPRRLMMCEWMPC